MATSPSPFPTEPTSLVLNQFEQKWLKLRMQDAVARSWAEACSISERLFSEPSPPDDLWERAIQRIGAKLACSIRRITRLENSFCDGKHCARK